MSTREQRVEVFRDTMGWIREDPRLARSVLDATSEVFPEDAYPALGGARSRDQRVEVTRERSFAAAQRLHAELPQARVAVLNFANAFHPGGGVTWGSSAQEECLCRTSTLYPLITTRELDRSFYERHRRLGRSTATDSLVYTRGVVVCKSDTDLPQRLPERDWIGVDVITCAAPDLSASALPDAALFGYHVRRAIHILTVAAAEGARALVLGAFGCGAFCNEPTVVARAWRVALGEFSQVFDRVTFAVWCREGSTGNFDAFRATMGERDERTRGVGPGLGVQDSAQTA